MKTKAKMMHFHRICKEDRNGVYVGKKNPKELNSKYLVYVEIAIIKHNFYHLVI